MVWSLTKAKGLCTHFTFHLSFPQSQPAAATKSYLWNKIVKAVWCSLLEEQVIWKENLGEALPLPWPSVEAYGKLLVYTALVSFSTAPRELLISNQLIQAGHLRFFLWESLSFESEKMEKRSCWSWHASQQSFHVLCDKMMYSVSWAKSWHKPALWKKWSFTQLLDLSGWVVGREE